MGEVQQLIVHFGNQEHTTAHHLVRALRDLGVEVMCEGAGHAARRVTAGPEIPLLWVESGVASFPALEQLGSRRSAAWLIDTHRGLDWRAPLAAAFDLCFAAQRSGATALAGLGVNARWLPLAAPAHPSPVGADERTTPVAFVGFVEPGSRRHRLLEGIDKAHRIWRNDTYMAPDEMLRRYACSQIVVNIPLANDLNMRLFEAAGAGAFVITGPMDGLSSILPEDLVAVVDSDDPSAWVAAIERALLDPMTAARALKAMQVINKDHLYRHRAQVILGSLTNVERRAIPVEERRRALLRAAVARHALKDAWRVSGPSAAGWLSLIHELLPEAARSLRRRLTYGRGRSA
jgi:hypothetical protein